jgi:3-hydroxyisobutyrate dehydrogenase-like beta-hydroxyacid dehydrogenase
MNNTPRFAVIGFGEVGQILAADLLEAGAQPAGLFDVLFADPASRPSRSINPPLAAAATARDAVRGAQLVISAVTAANGLDAARSVAGALEPGAFFLDVNSVSPEVKRQSAEAVTAAGGRYVEAAVMTSVPPKRIASPMLLGGPHAEAFLEMATPLGFCAQAYSPQIGRASAVKMCRSVMIKGMEALVAESLLTARRLGVEQDVLASLQDTIATDWDALARYMLMRSLKHGKRRAEEVREVARTVAEAHVEPLMSRAIAERQDLA